MITPTRFGRFDTATSTLVCAVAIMSATYRIETQPALWTGFSFRRQILQYIKHCYIVAESMVEINLSAII